MMPPILTVTLNPALDLAGAVPQVVPGPKLRIRDLTVEPGGGGINVARVIHRLGGETLALAALGGPAGARVAALLHEEGVAVASFDAPGDTRQSLSVTDAGDGQQYRFVLPGPDWTAAAAHAVLDAIVAAAAPQGWVVLSGSQPPGIPPEFPQHLTGALARLGARLVVDTSGPALERLVASPDAAARPAVLRMDRAESEALAGAELPSPAASLDLAADMVARGVADIVVLARGAEGSVLATDSLRLHALPPQVAVTSAVGAGDSFTAAFTLALAQGADPGAALRHGTAAAAAAVTTPATELCRAEDIARLLPACRLKPA